MEFAQSHPGNGGCFPTGCGLFNELLRDTGNQRGVCPSGECLDFLGGRCHDRAVHKAEAEETRTPCIEPLFEPGHRLNAERTIEFQTHQILTSSRAEESNHLLLKLSERCIIGK